MGIFTRIAIVFSVIYTVILVVGIGALLLILQPLAISLSAESQEVIKSVGNTFALIVLLAAASLACSWRILTRFTLSSFSPLTIRDFIRRHLKPLSIGLSIIGTSISLALYFMASLHFSGHLEYPGAVRVLILFTIQGYLIYQALSYPLKVTMQSD